MEGSMPSTLIVILPLLPGKQEAWRQFCQTLQGSRHREYDGCLHRMGITRQVVWLSQSMRCDAVQIDLHVEQCEQMVMALATSAHPFDRWLRKQLLELHGLDLSQFARAVHELIFVWPPDHVTAVPDEEQPHEKGGKHMRLEKNPTTGQIVELFGPTVEYLTSSEDEHNDFCVLKGTIPPGASVPLHSHADTEDFLIISGAIEGLRHDTQGYTWIAAKAGDYIHVPGNAQHAWRNVSDELVICLIITTKRIGHFFQEVGRSLTDAAQPPTPEDLARFAAVSARYGYWNATPEENAAVGIEMSS
jgi:quercetin dioxygenase-like cupin family protein